MPFVSDPGISRHLARFLKRSLENVRSDEHLSELMTKHRDLSKLDFLQPTAVLFNGGVFNAAPVRERVMELTGQMERTWQKSASFPARNMIWPLPKGGLLRPNALRRKRDSYQGRNRAFLLPGTGNLDARHSRL